MTSSYDLGNDFLILIITLYMPQNFPSRNYMGFRWRQFYLFFSLYYVLCFNTSLRSLGTSSKMWKKNKIQKLVSNYTQKAFKIAWLSIMLAIGFICGWLLLYWVSFYFFFAHCFYDEQVLNFSIFCMLTWSYAFLLICELYFLIFECWTNIAFLV